MVKDSGRYRGRIEEFRALMLANEALADRRLSEDRWTLKEMVGHLLDSATNNHQRFVRLQLEDDLRFPGYDAEEWRAVSGVSELDYAFLVRLWFDYNCYLLHLVGRMPQAALGRVWRAPAGDKSLGFLVEDYFAHLEWHRELFERRVGELVAAGAGREA